MISNKKIQKLSFAQKLLWVFGLCFFAMPTFANAFNYINGVSEAIIITQDVAMALGLSLFLGGLFKLKKYGEMRTFMSTQMSLSRPLGMLIGGVALLCLPLVTSTLLSAIWGTSSLIAYPVVPNPQAQEIIFGIILTIRLVGVMGVMRGIILLSRAGGEQSQPGSIGKAVLHLVGGLMCLNIMSVWNIFDNLLSF